MKNRSFLFFVFVATLIAALPGMGIAQQAKSSKVRPDVWETVQKKGVVRVIVGLDVPWQPEGKLRQGARLLQRQAIATAQDELLATLTGTIYKVIRRFQILPSIALEVGPDALTVLDQSLLVTEVVEDRPVDLQLQQSAPLVEADQAWAAGFDGTGWVVAVLDTGVDKNHPFLMGSVLVEACFSSNGNCPDGSMEMIGPGAGIPCTYAMKGCKHGTHVAGIVAGQGASFSGVAKSVGLIAIQVFSEFTGDDCAGNIDPPPGPCTRSFPTDQMAALEYVFLLQGTVQTASANMSLGGGSFIDQSQCDMGSPRMKSAIDTLRSEGIATVIAAGNNSCNGTGCTDAVSWPACISSAISVGSTTKTDQISSFSNSAHFLSLVAPGGDGIPGSTGQICSSVPSGTGTTCFFETDFASVSGTSMAAPHVAAAWAILKQKSPTATVRQVLAALQTTSLPIKDTRAPVTEPLKRQFQCRIRIRQALDYLLTQFITLEVPGAVATEAWGINKCSQIVGVSTDATFTRRGFLLSNGQFTTIEFPGARDTLPSGINNAGQIVGGTQFVSPTSASVFLLSEGEFTTIDVPGATLTAASGINNFGKIVGTFIDDASEREHGFFLSGGVFTTIDVPGAITTNAHGINDSSRIVGRFVADSTNHGFFLSGGVFTTIDVPGASDTVASGVNNAGEITGYFFTPSHGFLLSGGVFTTIAVPGATRTNANGINDSAQIVGSSFDDTTTRGFLFNSLAP